MAALPEPRRTPQDLQGWVRLFGSREIPILANTAAALEELRANEDKVDARMIAETIAHDPLMTLKVLAHIGCDARYRKRMTDVETVTAALVLIGISPFFRIFGPQPTVEDHLANQPDALEGLQAVMRRAYRAARFALGFAVHRLDHDAGLIYEAALLHDFAEMLLWLHAPALALEIADRQQADPTARTAALQRELLGVELPDVQHNLMVNWRLPEMLIRITDDRHQEQVQVRNVVLAIRLARHTSRGWNNAALPDDIADIASMLTLGVGPAETLLRDLDN